MQHPRKFVFVTILLVFVFMSTISTVAAQDDDDSQITPEMTMSYEIQNTLTVNGGTFLLLTDDGSLVVTADWDDETGEFVAGTDTASGEEVFRVNTEISVYDLVFSPDQSQVIVVGSDDLGILDIATGNYEIVAVLDDADGYYEMSGTRYNEDGLFVVADNGNDDLTLINVDITTGEYTNLSTVPYANLYAISPDASQVAFTDFNGEMGQVYLTDVESGETALLGEYPQYDPFVALAFSDNGDQLVVANDSAAAMVFDVETGEELALFVLYDPDVGEFDLYGATFLTDTIIVGGAQYELQFLDITTGEVIGMVSTGDIDYVGNVAVSADGRVIVTAVYDSVVVLSLPDNE